MKAVEKKFSPNVMICMKCQLNKGWFLMVHGRNVQLKKEFKNAQRTFLRFSSRIDMATTCSVVIRSFVIISPKPHLRLARLNFRSTSTRSQNIWYIPASDQRQHLFSAFPAQDRKNESPVLCSSLGLPCSDRFCLPEHVSDSSSL